jgi:hypothetical protein
MCGGNGKMEIEVTIKCPKPNCKTTFTGNPTEVMLESVKHYLDKHKKSNCDDNACKSFKIEGAKEYNDI